MCSKSYYEFECGCKFPIGDTEKIDIDGIPSLDIDLDNINLDCPMTWEMLQRGYTRGVFQLENERLGGKWAKELQPSSVEDMCALISLIRPGCLQSKIGDKSMTEAYCARKNGKDKVEYIHPEVESIFNKTYGVYTFQEQTIELAQKIAGFNGAKAMKLLKGVGKKKVEIITALEQEFMEGCLATGNVDEDVAKELFQWIRESQRYLFNKSHGIEYGLTGYWTAYMKAHFPLHFFCAWLGFAKSKPKPQKEIRELTKEASNCGIGVDTPSILDGLNEFGIRDGRIKFGLSDVKGIGSAEFESTLLHITNIESKLGKALKELSWYELLIHFTDLCTKTVINNLILVGGLSHTRVSRSRMVYEYNLWRQLSDREKGWIRENTQYDFATDLQNLLDFVPDAPKNKPVWNKNRRTIIESALSTLQNPPYSLDDTYKTIARYEKELLGVPITCSALESVDSYRATCTCGDILRGAKRGAVAVEIREAKEYVIAKEGNNKGKTMCFLDCEDDSAELSAIVFPDSYMEYGHMLYPGATVLLIGAKSGKDDSFVVDKVVEL